MKTRLAWREVNAAPDNPNLKGWAVRELEKPCVVQIGDYAARIPATFQWNGGSDPRVLWPFFGKPFDVDWLHESLFHDYAYYTHTLWDTRNEKWELVDASRSLVDRLFRESLVSGGYGRFRAWLAWAGVRMAAWRNWDNDSLDDEYLWRLSIRIRKARENPEHYGIILKKGSS